MLESDACPEPRAAADCGHVEGRCRLHARSRVHDPSAGRTV